MKAERYEHVLDPRSGERPVCSRQSLVSTDGTCETTYPRTKQDSQRATSLFPLSPAPSHPLPAPWPLSELTSLPGEEKRVTRAGATGNRPKEKNETWEAAHSRHAPRAAGTKEDRQGES
ncbi:hypothetical protein NDU88_003571 [Pleurodeles waltl]|uniref:Uncharacterized protein n=1 Tax=Pleurodeles waltl TaxID=8319 RepID=A0AAV7V2T0_PLEWA|nr:hypothetical protein NDU88_003571 [Pleurodeles waltl]